MSVNKIDRSKVTQQQSVSQCPNIVYYLIDSDNHIARASAIDRSNVNLVTKMIYKGSLLDTASYASINTEIDNS